MSGDGQFQKLDLLWGRLALRRTNSPGIFSELAFHFEQAVLILLTAEIVTLFAAGIPCENREGNLLSVDASFPSKLFVGTLRWPLIF